jgi:UDP-3-O-[3-hydroxymyristoyl] glucosamine N-acyltransferase
MNNYLISNPYLLPAFLNDVKRSNGKVIELKSEDGFTFDLSGISVSKENQYYLISNGDFTNQGRISLFAKLMEHGIKLEPLISENSFCSESSKIGMGSVIYSNVQLDENSTIGFNTIVAPNTIVQRDVKIGNHCFIGPSVILESGVKIGNNVYIDGNIRIVKNIEIERDVIINNHYQTIFENIKSGLILDSQIGDFVKIIR